MLINLIHILVFTSFLFLSFIIFSNPLKVNKKANIWFGFFLLLWATFWLDEILILIKAKPLGTLSSLMLYFFQFLTPIILYLSIVFFTNPNYKFRIKDISYIILPIVYLILLFNYRNTTSIFVILLISHAFFYALKSYFKIRKHQQQIALFSSNTFDINLKWLEHIILGILFISIIIAIFNLFYFGLPLNLYVNIIMLFTAYFISYNALKQKEIFPKEKYRDEIITINTTEANNQTSTKRKLVSDNELIELKSKLIHLITKEHLYLSHDINLASLSERLEVTPHQLSYVINNGLQQNFFQFINSYRIERAKILLLEKSSEKLTILGIAYESGFSSKTAFNTTFKKFTNQTPSQFKKQYSDL